MKGWKIEACKRRERVENGSCLCGIGRNEIWVSSQVHWVNGIVDKEAPYIPMEVYACGMIVDLINRITD